MQRKQNHCMSKLRISNTFLEKLAAAERLVFFTGAGISAESGISTFRGEDGIWKKFKPSELANMSAFMRNPAMVWEWYQYRRKIIEETAPNAAHNAITELSLYYTDVTVVTQNVDNLHRRAENKTIWELHGNIEKNFCMKCKKRYDFMKFDGSEGSPKCECGGLIRPDVVWFGEMLPQRVFQEAEIAIQNCDILFSIGTSAVVYPAAGMPEIARQSGAYMIEINPESTEQSYLFNEHFRTGAVESMTAVLEEVRKLRQLKK